MGGALGRLIVVLVLALFGVQAHAAKTCAQLASDLSGPNCTGTDVYGRAQSCTTHAFGSDQTQTAVDRTVAGVGTTTNWSIYACAYVPPPPPAQTTCSGRPEIVMAIGADTVIDNAGCVYAPYGDVNHTVCIDASGEHYCTGEVHMKPTGAYTQDNPPANADPVPPPPKACGGGSCYDPGSGQYCAVGSTGQVCVTAGPSAPSGGCVTGGDLTLCAGTPAPIPPSSKVPDPPSNIASHDTYADTTGAGSSGAQTTYVSVNNYNTSGSVPNSGQSTGDVGPGSSDDSGDKPVTASGGGDCGSPPVVSGDAAAQAIAYQAWATRCAVEKQNAGLGTGQVGNLHNLYTPSTETVGSVVSDFQSSVQTTPIGSAVTGFFQVNGMGGSCPVWTVPASDFLPAMTFDFYCRPELSDLLDLARLVILIACAYAAFRIAFGDA